MNIAECRRLAALIRPENGDAANALAKAVLAAGPGVGERLVAVMEGVSRLTVGQTYEVLSVSDQPPLAVGNETHTVVVVNDTGHRESFYFPSQLAPMGAL